MSKTVTPIDGFNSITIKKEFVKSNVGAQTAKQIMDTLVLQTSCRIEGLRTYQDSTRSIITQLMLFNQAVSVAKKDKSSEGFSAIISFEYSNSQYEFSIYSFANISDAVVANETMTVTKVQKALAVSVAAYVGIQANVCPTVDKWIVRDTTNALAVAMTFEGVTAGLLEVPSFRDDVIATKSKAIGIMVAMASKKGGLDDRRAENLASLMSKRLALNVDDKIIDREVEEGKSLVSKTGNSKISAKDVLRWCKGSGQSMFG